MALEVQIQTCELCGHKEKKIPQPPRHRSQRSRPVVVNFGKIKIFVFYGPIGTGLDL